MSNAISGSLTKILYGWEAVSYKTEAASINKVLGWGQKPNVTRRMNLQEVLGTGGRNVQKLVKGKFEGGIGLDFTMANGYWTRFFLGAAPTDAGATPYTHTYSESDSMASGTIEYNRPTDTPSISRLLGCKCVTAEISGQVGQVVSGKMQMVYADEKHYTTTANTATEAEEPFSFADFSLTVGSAYADVQSFSFGVNNTTKLLHGCGSIVASQAIGHERKYTLKTRIPYEQSTELLDAIGGSSGVIGPSNKASATFSLSNGLTGTSQRSYLITLANLKMDEFDEAPSTDDVLMADITLKALSCTSIVYSNNTAAAP
jgi:hypothetical protein